MAAPELASLSFTILNPESSANADVVKTAALMRNIGAVVLSPQPVSARHENGHWPSTGATYGGTHPDQEVWVDDTPMKDGRARNVRFQSRNNQESVLIRYTDDAQPDLNVAVTGESANQTTEEVLALVVSTAQTILDMVQSKDTVE
jgi:hypothetical protein